MAIASDKARSGETTAVINNAKEAITWICVSAGTGRDTSNKIAAAVEEQAATLQDINQNIHIIVAKSQILIDSPQSAGGMSQEMKGRIANIDILVNRYQVD